jgi:hypothetical protein
MSTDTDLDRLERRTIDLLGRSRTEEIKEKAAALLTAVSQGSDEDQFLEEHLSLFQSWKRYFSDEQIVRGLTAFIERHGGCVANEVGIMDTIKTIARPMPGNT